MKIFIKEITDQDKSYHFRSDTQAWVDAAVRALDEAPVSTKAVRPLTDFDFHTRKVDEVFVTHGHIEGAMHLLCSRCASPFFYPYDIDFQSLYSNDPDTSGDAHAPRTPYGKQRQNQDNLDYHSDITLLREDYIDLGAILSEQIELEKPSQPLCQAACKGMCQHCGADLNVGRCACNKIKQDSPFGVLKGLIKRSS